MWSLTRQRRFVKEFGSNCFKINRDPEFWECVAEQHTPKIRALLILRNMTRH